MSRNRKRTKQSFVPLTPARFEVLVSLASGDKHGYAILKDVERRSEGAVKFSVSTLYSVLDRLHEDGLIRESSERPDPSLDDERRRYYCLTPLGSEVAAAEAERLARTLSQARAFTAWAKS